MRTSLLATLLLAAPLALHAQTYSRAPHPSTEALPADAQAALSARANDGSWDARFGHPSVRYTVHTLAVAPNGDLYAGGDFTVAGLLPARNVARWDGQRWHALKEGTDNSVHALAFGPDGALYVGGEFTTAGTVQASGIARWDPTTETWSAVGSGLSTGTYRGYVYALAFHGATLYAGGDFTDAGITPVKNLARWDGTRWENLGAGLGRISWDGTFVGEGGSVRALAVEGSDVYVGGSFNAVAEGRANSIARFDTQTGTFHTMGEGVSAYRTYEGPGTVTDIAVQNGQVCVAGRFERVGAIAPTPTYAGHVACWDGAGWDVLSGGVQKQYGATTSSVVFLDDALVVGGDFTTASGQQARYLAQWNGAAWTEIGGGIGSASTDLVGDGKGGFFVSGAFDAVGSNVGALRIAHWTGGEWHALGQGLAYNSIAAGVYALTRSGGRTYAGGFMTHAGGVPVSNIAAWDGTRWHALGTGTDNTVRALATGPNGEVYAGGDFTVAGGQAVSHIARWDPVARTWSAMGSGTNGAVHALAVAPNGDLYAGGAFSAAGGVAAKSIARWDGAAWHSLNATPNGNVLAIALLGDGRVVAGGDFKKLGDVVVNGIAMWNGTAWTALDGGVQRNASGYTFSGSVYGLAATPAGDIYAAGYFDMAGTSAAAGVARWNATTGWSALGAGLGGGDKTGHALTVVGPWLYVGGDFASAGGQPSSNVAAYDTRQQTWSAMGSGTNGFYDDVLALAPDGGDVYAGGRFDQIDGKPASSIALWHGETPEALAQIAIDPLTVDFGDQTVGTTVDLMVSITNLASATAPLTGAAVLPAGTPFSLAEGGGAFTVPPGGAHQIIVRFDPQTAGAATATLTIQHNASNMAAEAAVTLRGTGVSRGGPIVLRGFDPNGVQVTLGTEAGGFVFGTNGYGDRAKGVAFTVPMGKDAQNALVTAINVWFSYADPLPGEATYTLSLYNGTAQTGPQAAPFYSKVYRVADIQSDDNLQTRSEATVHALDTPLAVQPGASFFAVVDFSAYASRTNLLAIAAGEEVAHRVPEVWDQDKNGVWGNVSDLWTGGEKGWPIWIEAELGTSTPTETTDSPATLALEGAAPNPFHTTTTLRYTLEKAGPVVLDVFDVMGRRVATLVQGSETAGSHTATLDAEGLASGTYVVRLHAGGRTLTRPVVLAR